MEQYEKVERENNEQRRMMYTVLIDDIRFTKQQIWSLFYQIVVAIASVTTIILNIPGKVSKLLCLSTAIIIFIGLYGLITICDMNKALEKYRTQK